MMLSINVVITQGDRIGWLNPLILILIAIFIVTLIAFYIFENVKMNLYRFKFIFK